MNIHQRDRQANELLLDAWEHMTGDNLTPSSRKAVCQTLRKVLMLLGDEGLPPVPEDVPSGLEARKRKAG